MQLRSRQISVDKLCRLKSTASTSTSTNFLGLLLGFKLSSIFSILGYFFFLICTSFLASFERKTPELIFYFSFKEWPKDWKSVLFCKLQVLIMKHRLLFLRISIPLISDLIILKNISIFYFWIIFFGALIKSMRYKTIVFLRISWSYCLSWLALVWQIGRAHVWTPVTP